MPTLAVALLGLSGCGQEQSSKPKVGLLPAGQAPPNIIFILVDTLRADCLGAYGHPGGLTPNMDQIASEGVLFERCFANAPWTLPSVASMLTCYHPAVHGATSYAQVQAMHDKKTPAISVLNEDQFNTLPELLHEAGYEAAGFVANKFLMKEFGFAQGYDHYDASFSDNTVRGEVVNNAALTWLRQRKSQRPLFLYLHYMDVHGPYNAAREFMDPLIAKVRAIPPEKRTTLSPELFNRINPYLRKPPANGSDLKDYEELRGYREYWVARYEAGVAELDHYLGELIRELKALKLWDDAYVVLTADHGESLGEHGYWDHGYTLFNAELHVPFVLRWPGVLAAGRRIRENASLLDITPTLMEQLRASAAGQVQGRSLVNSLSGIPPKQPVPVFAGAIKAGPEADAVLREDWKLIRIKAGQNQGGAQGGYLRLLMNFAADPGETKSVWGSNAAIGKELETILDAQVEANKSVRPAYEVEFRELSPELIQQLKAGGYVASGSGDEEAQSQPTTRPTTAPAGTKP